MLPCDISMSSTIPCPDGAVLERLVQALRSGSELEVLLRHLAVCETCAARVRSMSTEHATEAIDLLHLADALARQVPTTELPAPRRDSSMDSTIADRLGRSGTRPRSASVIPIPVIPGYDIMEELGRGSMGIVYRARQVSLHREVALKMPLAGAQAADELRRFRTEAQAAAALQHPNIIQIFEIGTHDNRPFFTMELVEGGNLDVRLSRHPWEPHDAATLVETLAGAVHYANSRAILHRDLKPSNILFTPAGLPKISDFGLAKKLDASPRLTGTGVILGTPSYMAPEQVEPGTPVGPATDVYALGAILYETMTGRPPFQAVTAVDTMLQVMSLDPIPPSALNAGVPRDLETICLKCLEKSPGRRYPTAQALREDMARFRRGEPVRARPARAIDRWVKWVRRKPALAALSAIIVLSALALAITAGLGLWAVTDLADDLAGESHSHEVLSEAERVLSLVKDAETGQRGFLLTGDTRYLDPYDDAIAELRQALDRLQPMTADNPRQQKALQGLRGAIDDKLRELKQTIQLRKGPGGFDAALKVVKTDQGKDHMERVRSLVALIQEEEKETLRRRNVEVNEETKLSRRILYAGIAPAVLLLLAPLGMLLMRVVRRVHGSATQGAA
jgi:CHASE3 domain sensor protein/tRNA A-37 threonylcarbamoyl transferase component Bud32